MHYFKGSMSEWDIKWKLSWRNFMLYMASIPQYDADSTTTSEPELKSMEIENWC